MRTLLLRLWRDEGGSVMPLDWTLLASILVLGAITGLVASQQIHLPEPDEPTPAHVR